MAAREQFVLTLSERGFGKRSSSFEYRTSGRGGKGIVAMVVNERNGLLSASFPVDNTDQIILVTDAGQLIRTSVDQVRIAGRNTQGVRVFRTDADEKVVSVERIPEVANGENGVADEDDEGVLSAEGLEALGIADTDPAAGQAPEDEVSENDGEPDAPEES